MVLLKREPWATCARTASVLRRPPPAPSSRRSLTGTPFGGNVFLRKKWRINWTLSSQRKIARAKVYGGPTPRDRVLPLRTASRRLLERSAGILRASDDARTSLLLASELHRRGRLRGRHVGSARQWVSLIHCATLRLPAWHRDATSPEPGHGNHSRPGLDIAAWFDSSNLSTLRLLPECACPARGHRTAYAPTSYRSELGQTEPWPASQFRGRCALSRW